MNWLGLPEYIEARIIPEPNSGCWLWLGRIGANGYGYYDVPGKKLGESGRQNTAHRGVYLLYGRNIPDGLHLDHLCRNRLCCNPDHLEPVTPGENARRGETGKYQSEFTHCPRGHPYDAANTYIGKKGSRHCRRCNLISTWRRRGKI